MKFTKSLTIAAALFSAVALGAPAMAQESNYKPGSVWQSSRIKVLPGQFENYMDWLKNNWKPNMEFLKAEGWLLSYHVLSVNHRRDGEPHLILVQEWRDYPTNAQMDQMSDKWLASRRSNDREAATQNGARQVMRIQRGNMQMQELVLK